MKICVLNFVLPMESEFENLVLSRDEEEELILEPEYAKDSVEVFDHCLVGRFLTDQSINFNSMQSRLGAL
ncbi:hypothetical protein ACS0TY_020911 [Phlomoides rotata]